MASRSTRSLAFTLDTSANKRAFDQAYDDYLEVSDVLMADLTALLDGPLKSGAERRNFLRAAWALIEADAESLRRMVAAVAQLSAARLSSAQLKLIENERGLSACDRVKESLKMAYAVFALTNPPDFGAREWPLACESSGRRDQLMHPKTLADLEFSEQAWFNYYQGMTWAISQFRDFHRRILKEYGGSES